MIDAQGTVTAVDGDYAIVRMDETGCGRCHEQGGCGGNNIGQMFCSTPRTFRVLNPGQALVGDQVRVAVADGAVRHGALYAYAFPLSALFAGAIGGGALLGDLGAIFGAFGSLLGAWLLLRCAHLRRKPDSRFQAYIRT